MNINSYPNITAFKVSFEITFDTDDSWEEDELEQLSKKFISNHLPGGWSHDGIHFGISKENVKLIPLEPNYSAGKEKREK